jgi:hypothetical protein
MIRIVSISILVLISNFISAQKTDANNKLAQKILAKTIKAHGGKKYDKAKYQFTFRDNIYRFKNSKKGYNYTVRKSKGGQHIYDQLINGDFSRSINGKNIELTEKEKRGGAGGLNSVIYFATLPHKLNDPAVQLSYAGEATVKGVNYDVLQVRFEQDGGGVDHDDEYVYWIRKDNNQIDYFAYNYQVNGGGVRFRSGFNKRKVKGIVFQDYINYKAPVGTPLVDLPAMYEQNQLKELSKILTEKVTSIN